jgi:hypothetical protein
LRFFLTIIIVALLFPNWGLPVAVGQSRRAPAKLDIPDFTQGDPLPENAKHDWNLGPTGLRGWMFCDKLVTNDARQILITQVDVGSPAAGRLQVGDVILGVAGERFASDPRTEFGRAITAAESDSGELVLTRWRAGSVDEVTLPLSVLGDYGPQAPFDCGKSRGILELGCRALAARMSSPDYLAQRRLDPIPRSLNAMALLASGKREYLPLVKREAEWAAQYSATSMQTWRYGYCMMLLAEYIVATGDDSVLPGLRRLALEAANGQSGVGSWGHGFARPDGRLRGYGMMNAPGLPLTISLVMAQRAGVTDPEVGEAIERSARLLRFYIGKGAIPYGDHHPWIETHEDNGKCGMAAVLFNLLGESEGAAFFTRMSVASHGPERDCGHTGNYFNMLWALPGVSQAGPEATGAWMEEFGGWYLDLARRWDHSFSHQGPPEPNPDSYSGWDSSGAFLLAYALPLKKIMLTGKIAPIVPALNADEAQALILDGRGWDNKDRTGFYDALTEAQLIQRLRSWSPVVRERAAMALVRRPNSPVADIVALLSDEALEPRYGACQALVALRGRGAPAVERLQTALHEDDLWLRIKAAEALASIGEPAKTAVPQLLELLATVDPNTDPRGMQQRYFTFALFENRDGMLSRSLEGVDRDALYRAVRVGLANQDGRARGSLGSVYRNLSGDELAPIFPAIYQAVVEPAPSGEMFADSIRVEGLRLMAKHHIEEGLAACVQYTRDQNPWASEKRTPELMDILLTYGTHAKSVIPQLVEIADYFENDEPDFPRQLMLRKAACVRETIQKIEAATETPELVRLPKIESASGTPGP